MKINRLCNLCLPDLEFPAVDEETFLNPGHGNKIGNGAEGSTSVAGADPSMDG